MFVLHCVLLCMIYDKFAQPDAAVKLFAVMQQEGLEANAYVYNAIIDAHVRTER
jgi:hypothetical protein